MNLLLMETMEKFAEVNIMSFIENIKRQNQFSILFIGSGITQRYFKNAPSWEGLLIKWKSK